MNIANIIIFLFKITFPSELATTKIL